MAETVWAGYHVSLGVARIAQTARRGWSLCGVSVAAVCDVWARARAREGGGGRLARDGDASGHAGIRVTSRIMGNRHAIGTGWSLIIRTHVQKPGDSVVLSLFIFVDVRKVIPHHRLRMPLVSRSRIREGIRCRKHVRCQRTRPHRVRQREGSGPAHAKGAWCRTGHGTATPRYHRRSGGRSHKRGIVLRSPSM